MNDALSSTADSQKNAATLEREIDQTRAQMNQTLGALENKFSPAEFFDQALNLVRQHGGEIATNVGNVIRENPMPVLLTAAGVAWMVLSTNRPKTSLKARTADYEYDPSAEEYGQASSNINENESGVLAQAGQQIRSGVETTRQKLTSSKEAVASSLSKTAESAQVQAARVRDGFRQQTRVFNDLLEEQPLIVGALGIALGAAIGAVLPTTEQEDRLLGSARDKAIAQIKETGSESMNQVRESVTRVAKDAKQAVSETLSPDTQKTNPNADAPTSAHHKE